MDVKEILDKETFLREVYAYLKSLRTFYLPVDGHRVLTRIRFKAFLQEGLVLWKGTSSAAHLVDKGIWL